MNADKVSRTEVDTVNRNKTMTDRECLEAMLKGEKPERVVYWECYSIAIAALRAGMTIKEAYIAPKKSYASQKKFADEFGILFNPVWSCIGGDFGGESDDSGSFYSQGPATTRFPINNLDDIRNLETPIMGSTDTLKKGLEFSRLSASEKLDNEPFNVTFNCSGPFTRAGHLCGVNRLSHWLIEEPEMVHRLLRITTEYIIQGAEIWLKNFKNANIMLMISEPIASNQIISPEHFHEFAFPYIKDVHETVLKMGYKHIFCHICGDQNANLKYWAKIPMGDPGIISIGHEIDIKAAARCFPDDIVHGNLNPLVLQVNTPAEIYEDTRRVVEQGKQVKGRFVFGQGCEIPPRAKKESLLAMIKAVDDYGWY